MDRMAVAVIVIGIFAGSIQALLLNARPLSATLPLAESPDALLLDTKDQGPEGLGYEIVIAPEELHALDELRTLTAGDAKGSVRGEGAFDNQGEQPGIGYPAGNPISISMRDEGIEAYYQDPQRRIIYVGYGLALVTLRGAQGTESTIMETLRALPVDATEARLCVLLPNDMVQLLDQLVRDGVISSYELGGWGSGLGKA